MKCGMKIIKILESIGAKKMKKKNVLFVIQCQGFKIFYLIS